MTILDAGLDAAAALAFVADELGDRSGAVAFDDEVRAALPPRRAGGQAVVRALFDLEPRPLDSDYELAFRRAEGSKRALVVVFCDLLEETAARPLVRAVPGAHPPPRGRGRQPVATPRSSALAAAAGDDPLTPRARRSPATSSTPAPAPPRRSGPPARACSRRRRTGCPRRSSPPTCGPRRAPCSEVSRPRQTRAPRTATNSDDAQASPGPRRAAPARSRSPRGTRTARATAIVPDRDLDRRARLAPQRRRRAAAAPAGSAPSRSAARRRRRRRCRRSPAARARRSAAGTRSPLPAPIASPAITPSSSPLKNSAQTVSTPERDPAHERQQRHLDVVGHDLERERRRGRRRRSRGPRPAGRRRPGTRAGIRPAAAGGSTSAPHGAEHARARAAAPTRRTAAPAARPAAASSRATEAPERRAPPGARVDRRARPQHSGSSRAISGSPGSAGARTRGRPPPRDRASPSRRTPSAPEPLRPVAGALAASPRARPTPARALGCEPFGLTERRRRYAPGHRSATRHGV